LATSYEDYPERAFDVADTAAFLAHHPEWSRQPVDGTPIRWQPATGELAVQPVGTYQGARRFGMNLRTAVAVRATPL
jgi:hypothetical protein